MSSPQKATKTPEKATKTPEKATKAAETDFDAVLKAVKEVVVDKKGIRPTARAYGIDKDLLRRQTIKASQAFEDLSTIQQQKLVWTTKSKVALLFLIRSLKLLLTKRSHQRLLYHVHPLPCRVVPVYHLYSLKLGRCKVHQQNHHQNGAEKQ